MSIFKHRWRLRTAKSHGENGDAYVNAVAEELLFLRNTLAFYGRKDKFNTD